MKRFLLKSLLVLTVILLAFIFLQSRYSAADDAKFEEVVPFMAPNGNLGFFDQNNGKIYIYDVDMKNCILVSQMDELGRTMVPIKMR